METESLVSSEFAGHFYLFIFWLQAVNRVLNTLLLFALCFILGFSTGLQDRLICPPLYTRPCQCHNEFIPPPSFQPEPRSHRETHLLDSGRRRRLPHALLVRSEPGSGPEIPQRTL